jgi:hypothetical protein
MPSPAILLGLLSVLAWKNSRRALPLPISLRHCRCMAERFVIGGPWRLASGFLLAAAAAALANLGYRLEFGLSWVLWILAAVLLFPALHLVRRTALIVDQGNIDIEAGFLFKRSWRFALQGAELEIVPTAGLNTVVLHKRGHEIPLASWLSRRRANALCTFIDATLDAPLPRRASRKPEGDR